MGSVDLLKVMASEDHVRDPSLRGRAVWGPWDFAGWEPDRRFSHPLRFH